MGNLILYNLWVQHQQTKKVNLKNKQITWHGLKYRPSISNRLLVSTITSMGLKWKYFPVHGQTMAFFPLDETGIGGAVVSGPGSNPGEQGPLLYLNGGKDLNHMLGKIEQAGGRIIMPKTRSIMTDGYFAIFHRFRR